MKQTWKRVSQDRYWEMLGILPPAVQTGSGFLVGEPMDHANDTGRPRYAAFVEKGGRFYEGVTPMTVAEFAGPNAIDETTI